MGSQSICTTLTVFYHPSRLRPGFQAPITSRPGVKGRVQKPAEKKAYEQEADSSVAVDEAIMQSDTTQTCEQTKLLFRKLDERVV
jgi:hypothetical protein